MMVIGYVAIFRRVKESKTKVSISSQMEKNKGENIGSGYVSATTVFVIVEITRIQMNIQNKAGQQWVTTALCFPILGRNFLVVHVWKVTTNWI